MALKLSLFLAVSVSFLYGSGARGHNALENWPRHWEVGGGPPKENEQRPLSEIQDRRQKSLDPSKSLKLLDFSADNDYQRDDDGEITRAFSDFGALPESFTICSAFMVEASPPFLPPASTTWPLFCSNVNNMAVKTDNSW